MDANLDGGSTGGATRQGTCMQPTHSLRGASAVPLLHQGDGGSTSKDADSAGMVLKGGESTEKENDVVGNDDGEFVS